MLLTLRRILSRNSLRRRERPPTACFRKCSEFRRFIFTCEAEGVRWPSKSISEFTVGLINRENPAVQRMRPKPDEEDSWIRIELNKQQAFCGRCRCI